MKNLKHFALTLLVALLSCVSSKAYDFEVDGIYYNTLSLENLTCEVTYKNYDFNSYSGDVVIPSSVSFSGKTFTVIAIGNSAFRRCYNMTSVEIPNSVVSIGEMAFYNCI